MSLKTIIVPATKYSDPYRATFYCYDSAMNNIATDTVVSNIKSGADVTYTVPTNTVWIVATFQLNNDSAVVAHWTTPTASDNEVYSSLSDAVAGAYYYDATQKESITFLGSPLSRSYSMGYHKYKVKDDDLSVDLSTLEGWEDLPPGDNQISLQAMGAGYKDSDISEEVTVFKPYSIKPGDYRFISSPAAPTGFTELPITFITNRISVSKITFNNGNISYSFPSPLGTTQVYMANTNSWTLPAYRTIRITEEHTISKEQYDWFFANANRVYLIDAGTYTFRDYPHAQNMAQNINFTSNNTAYTVMAVGFTSDDVGGIYYRNSSSDTAYTRKSGWQQPFQTIVTSAVQEVTAEFYNWWNASI